MGEITIHLSEKERRELRENNPLLLTEINEINKVAPPKLYRRWSEGSGPPPFNYKNSL